MPRSSPHRRSAKESADTARILVERTLTDTGPARRAAPDRKHRSATINLAESPLGWLHARGHLTERQFDAGERLRRDYELAALAPSITMRWDAAPQSGQRRGAADHLEPGERQIAARRRFDAAMALLGRDLDDMAWRVICAAESVPVAEKAMGWPARSGKIVLRLALDRLADHYRLA